MSAFDEALRTMAVTFGPILLACLCGAIGWAWKRIVRKRR